MISCSQYALHVEDYLFMFMLKGEGIQTTKLQKPEPLRAAQPLGNAAVICNTPRFAEW